MAEVKKTIKLQKLVEKPLREYADLLASAEGKPTTGSATALVAALAVSLGSLAAATAAEDAVRPEVTKELDDLRKYMLQQVDEMVRSRTPLTKRLAEGADAEGIESAARVACGIPNEIVYMMCRTIEMLDQIADVCADDAVYTVLSAAHLALAVIAAYRGEIKALSQYMADFTFRYVVNREAEINVQEHQAQIDGLLAKLNKRLEK